MPVSHRRTQPHWPAPGGEARPFSPSGGGADDVRTSVMVESAQRWLDNRDGGRAVTLWRRALRWLWRRCNRLNAPVVYPWSPSRDGAAPAHALHRAAADVLRHHSDTPGGRWWRRAKAVAWPILALAAILPLLVRCGRFVHAYHGRTLRMQLRDLWRAAWRHGIFPTEYYHHRVFRGPPDRDLAYYLGEREIFAVLWAAGRGANAERVDNLRRFISECRACALPAPRLVAAFREGEISFCCESKSVTLPERDLFLRPASWDGGTPGQHWRWNSKARVWMYRDEALAAAALLQRGRKLSMSRAWLIQESVNNHPDIARFSAGGVCTVQVVTGADANGEIHPLLGGFHMPASAETGWGASPGELVAGVDLRDGRLDVALGEFVSDGEFAVHPGTGVTIAGAVLPQWDELRELVRRAHQRFAEIPFVAWRVALTGSGPMLLEASTTWSVFHHVWPAETGFASLCMEWIERLRDGSRGSVAAESPAVAAVNAR